MKTQQTLTISAARIPCRIIVGLCALLTASCSGLAGSEPLDAAATQVGQHGPTVVREGRCIDETGSVPSSFTRQAIAAAASEIRSVDAPTPERFIYVRAIREDSYSPAAAIRTLHLPAVGPRPHEQGGENPFDLEGRERSAAAERRKQEEWSDQRKKLRSVARRGAAEIASHQPSSEEAGTDTLGCFLKLAELLQGPGRRVLTVWSDLEPSGAQQIDAKLNLADVDVRVVLWCDRSASECQARQAHWKTLLERAGGRVQFLDPTEVDAL